MPKQTKQITMNVPVSLWDSLEELGESLGYQDGRGIHSSLVREIVSAVVLKWRNSPYICHSSHHIIFITKDGHIFYRLLQVLQLNSKRKRLPCAVEMKPEKIKDYLLRREPKAEEAEWFRSRWLLNHFAAWQGKEIQGKPLSFCVDLEGTTSKSADLEVDQGPGRFLTREMIVGIQEYVQWKISSSETEESLDRVDIPIDIPTRNLKITAIIDAALYRKTRLNSETEIPNLKMEFRNREGARFEDHAISLDPENPILDQYSGKFLGLTRPAKAEQMMAQLKELGNRVVFAAGARAERGRILSESDVQKLRDAFKMPTKFLYYEIDWPSPQFGLEVCVGWEKPVSIHE